MIPTEAQEQKALIEWAAIKKIGDKQLKDYLFAIPNGGSRNKIEAKHLKEQGVKAGIPDLFLFIPNNKHHGLFIELKRRKGAKISDAQKIILERLSLGGYKTEVAYGFEHAKQIIEEYLL